MVIYKCKKCNKSWQHPIKTCPFCLGNLERVSFSSKSKVLGVSKVSIPSILHPKVPYYSLIVESEEGTRYAYKTFSEVSVGDVIDHIPNNDIDSVSIWRINYDFLDGIKNIAELSQLDLQPDYKVLILPSLNSPTQPYFRDNTSPDFLEGTITFLKDNNIKDIKIAQQSFGDFPVEALAQKSGLLDVCLRNKIMPIDLSKSPFAKKGNLEVSEEYLNADIVLNLGIMKSGKASATENVFKVLKKDNYSALKYLQSEEAIAEELFGYSQKTFSFGEAQIVQRKDKYTAYWGAIFGSRNYFNLDRVFNETTMNKDLPKVISGIEIKNVPINGRTIEEIQRNIELVL